MSRIGDDGSAEQATVFIVDDDSAIREGLSNLLDAVGIRAEQYGSAEEFSEHWDRQRAGCLVLDVRLPGISGMELQEKLLQAGIPIPIIVMTGHGDIPMVRKVLKAGAVEFLTKPFPAEELLHAVEQAFAIDRIRRKEEGVLSSIIERFETLTAREREVLSMVTAGMLNKQIAAELNLSEITVKLHRRGVMEKMQAGSLAELAKMCERAKLPTHPGG